MSARRDIPVRASDGTIPLPGVSPKSHEPR